MARILVAADIAGLTETRFSSNARQTPHLEDSRLRGSKVPARRAMKLSPTRDVPALELVNRVRRGETGADLTRRPRVEIRPEIGAARIRELGDDAFTSLEQKRGLGNLVRVHP